jgi:hypothetical protein
VALWPRDAVAPMLREAKADYFDSLFHSAAVVGLNTSALIEAGIIGRPVHTILLPEFRGNQEGTLHFRYLIEGGLLHVARSLDEHLQQLTNSLRQRDLTHTRAFVQAFVRPHGLECPATQVLTAALERVGAKPVSVSAPSAAERALRRALLPLARATSGRFAQQVGRERRRRAEEAARSARRAARAAERDRRRAAHSEAKRRAAAALEEQRARQKAARLGERGEARR